MQPSSGQQAGCLKRPEKCRMSNKKVFIRLSPLDKKLPDQKQILNNDY